MPKSDNYCCTSLHLKSEDLVARHISAKNRNQQTVTIADLQSLGVPDFCFSQYPSQAGILHNEATKQANILTVEKLTKIAFLLANERPNENEAAALHATLENTTIHQMLKLKMSSPFTRTCSHCCGPGRGNALPGLAMTKPAKRPPVMSHAFVFSALSASIFSVEKSMPFRLAASSTRFESSLKN